MYLKCHPNIDIKHYLSIILLDSRSEQTTKFVLMVSNAYPLFYLPFVFFFPNFNSSLSSLQQQWNLPRFRTYSAFIVVLILKFNQEVIIKVENATERIDKPKSGFHVCLLNRCIIIIQVVQKKI